MDPNAQLYYNDYNLESGGAKAQGAQRIVQLIQSYGVKINGVGLQAHLSSEVTPTATSPAPDQATLEKTLRMFTSQGVDVAYTEIDVRMNTPATPAKLKKQADVYESVARSCLAVKRCVGMTTWGVSDKYSWIPETFEGEGALGGDVRSRRQRNREGAEPRTAAWCKSTRWVQPVQSRRSFAIRRVETGDWRDERRRALSPRGAGRPRYPSGAGACRLDY